MSRDYEPVHRMALWWLADPAQPMLVGELNLLKTGTRGVSLTYSARWQREGLALSKDLPLSDREHLPAQRDDAAGVVDDARPDRWGKRVIRHIDRPRRLSTLEMLCFAGDERFGALAVSLSDVHYTPHVRGALPRLADVDALHGLVRQVLLGVPVDEVQRRLLAPGTLGGARPKALVDIDGEPWILKFAEDHALLARGAEPLAEHAAMTLAALAGIVVARTRPVLFGRGQVAIAIQRFDRSAGGQRRYALSANVALRAAGVEHAYPDLAQLLRRRGPTEDDLNRRQMAELFRRMVFNLLIDNTDDHEKNHILIVRPDQHMVLSPAFDVLPTGHALGHQSMIVGTRGTESSIDNALSMARHFGLDPQAALSHAAAVARVVDGWRAHFTLAGVPAELVDELEAAIDGPFLRDQRVALLAMRP